MSRMTGYRCSGCLAMFHSISAFDRHRVGKFAKGRGRGSRRCMSQTEMLVAGLACDEKGFWRSAQRIDIEQLRQRSA